MKMWHFTVENAAINITTDVAFILHSCHMTYSERWYSKHQFYMVAYSLPFGVNLANRLYFESRLRVQINLMLMRII